MYKESASNTTIPNFSQMFQTLIPLSYSLYIIFVKIRF